MLDSFPLYRRVRDRLRRERADRFARRDVVAAFRSPVVSFSFDDFPKSALFCAGNMLLERGWRGTYYTSFGLAGTVAPTGTLFDLADVPGLIERRHELGCHTYGHLHAWETSPDQFEASMQENLSFLRQHFPGASFPSLSYPISCPNPGVKRRAGARFEGCRGGGQVCNTGTMDLNHLRSFFLEQVGENLETVRQAIDRTVSCQGWLIFSTHDVAASPTRYGVTPQFFGKVLAAVAESGARVLPVGAVLEEMRRPSDLPLPESQPILR